MPSALLGTGYPWMLMWLTDDLLTRRPVPVEAGLKRGLKVLQEHPSPVTDLFDVRIYVAPADGGKDRSRY